MIFLYVFYFGVLYWGGVFLMVLRVDCWLVQGLFLCTSLVQGLQDYSWELKMMLEIEPRATICTANAFTHLNLPLNSHAISGQESIGVVLFNISFKMYSSFHIIVYICNASTPASLPK